MPQNYCSQLLCIYFADLVLCDYCTKEFHKDCHIPKVHDIPEGKWMCCECSAVKFKKKLSCGGCDACLRTDACGECDACKTKVRFGGTLTRGGKQCELRQCKQKRYAAPESIRASSTTKRRKVASKCNKTGTTATKSNKSKPSVKKKFGDVNIEGSRFIASQFQTYSKLHPDDGLNSDEIKLTCLRATNKVSFMSKCFPNRILRVEKSLRDTPPERMIPYVSAYETSVLPSSSRQSEFTNSLGKVWSDIPSRLCKGERREERRDIFWYR